MGMLPSRPFNSDAYIVLFGSIHPLRISLFAAGRPRVGRADVTAPHIPQFECQTLALICMPETPSMLPGCMSQIANTIAIEAIVCDRKSEPIHWHESCS